MTRQFKFALAWLLTGSIAFGMALLWFPAAFVDGQYIPVGHDSFYHARRIVDAVGGNFYQFDPRIHAPEGSWLTWPWAYDRVLAAIVSLFMALTGKTQPMAILAYIPPFWVYINAALLLAITQALNMSWMARAVALSCFALSPLTQQLHAIGMVDHHYVEYTFVLATLCLGLKWARSGRWSYAVGLGMILGVAPAFHNGLFALQLPLLLFLFVLWLRDVRFSDGATAGFCAALFGTTLLGLFPSMPFWDMQFSFHTHSWFHLYVAACTCLLISLVQRDGFSSGRLWRIAGLGLLLALPVLSQVVAGMDFVLAKLPYYDTIGETRSVYSLAMERPIPTTEFYSALIWLMPLTIAAACLSIWHRPEPERLFLAVMTIFGGLLLLQQSRMHYFGSFALYLPLLLAWDNWLARPKGVAFRWRLLAAGLFIIAYIPAVGGLFGDIPPGQDFDYALTRNIYKDFSRFCDSRPGVVLADNNDGHYITYHTKCSVISDNFILTEQHIRKIQETTRLLELDAQEMMHALPAYVRYVYVRRSDNVLAADDLATILQVNSGARRDLLFRTPPDGLKLIAELNIRRPDGLVLPLARLFEVRRPEGS